MDYSGLVLAWLSDAYEMENSLIHVLERHRDGAQSYPQLEAKLQQHLEETHRHAGLVRSCIERLGGNVNPLKTAIAQLGDVMHGFATAGGEDALVKHMLADYAAEQFEVASYTALLAVARALGDPETVRTCEVNLSEDQDMARWLLEHLPFLTLETAEQRAQEELTKGMLSPIAADPAPGF